MAMTDAALAQSNAEPQDVLTTVRKRIELVLNEIADAELSAMLRTAMSELDLALAQSDAEPVCLWRYKGEKLWHECNEAEYRILGDNPEDVERRLLYTAPPRPDASAGLIEEVELHERAARMALSYSAKDMHLSRAEALRARAADRGGK